MSKSQPTAQSTVFVALSGGVDSSVAAALLKEQGYDVVGVHIKMWSDPSIPCAFKEDRYDAMRVAAKLDIPFETWDFTSEYKNAVVRYMIREYATLRTPNPDVMCNRKIKFGIFLQRALKRGANFIATGHYVKKSEIRNPKSEIIYGLSKAKDLNKDQSYFLWTLTQSQLEHCLFPIGEYTKPEVREISRKFNLPTSEKKESQGICFIGEIDVREFLKRHIPEEHGAVVTTSGKKVGEHEGLSFYTIGQRQGLGIGGGITYYVIAKDRATNTLLVSVGPYDGKLFSDSLDVTEVNWISGMEPILPFGCDARIRYRQPIQSCMVEKSKTLNPKPETLKVIFNESQRAPTPGQSLVLYCGDEMLGGGVIV